MGRRYSTTESFVTTFLDPAVPSNDVVNGDLGVTLTAVSAGQFHHAYVGGWSGHRTGDEDALDGVEGFDLHNE